MGLDACVYCDCYEKGRLLTPPPEGMSLKIGPDGGLERQIPGDSLELDLAFDEWRNFHACGHQGGVFIHHRLGNMGLVALLLSELQKERYRYPILCERVVYSGAHSGDFLAMEIIPALQRELDLLAGFKCGTRKSDEFMADFRTQMGELAAAALFLGKPIAF